MISFNLSIWFLFFDDWIDIHFMIADCDSLILDLFLDVIDCSAG